MVSSYTPSLRLTKQGTNDNPNTWGSIENEEVIALLDEAIAHTATIDCTGLSDIDLSATTENGETDNARHAVLKLTGLLGANINVLVPAVDKIYVIDSQQTGGFTITVKPIGATLGVSFPTGKKAVVYIQGTTISEVASSGVGASTPLLAANNLSDLTNVSDARNNLGLGTIAVQNANNVNITGGSITGVTGLSSVTSVAGRTGDVLLTSSDISGLSTLATKNLTVKKVVFTATGTYTPTTGMFQVFAEVEGGGGGGIAQSTGFYPGGGAGGYAAGMFTSAQIGASQIVTIGAGGASGVQGGTTSLGSLVSATGGSGGAANLGGDGGTGTGGDIQKKGQRAGTGQGGAASLGFGHGGNVFDGQVGRNGGIILTEYILV